MATTRTLDFRDQEFFKAIVGLETDHMLGIIVLQNLGYGPLWETRHGNIRIPARRFVILACCENGYIYRGDLEKWVFTGAQPPDTTDAPF